MDNKILHHLIIMKEWGIKSRILTDSLNKMPKNTDYFFLLYTYFNYFNI